MPAPQNNQNARRHGLRSNQVGDKSIENEVGKLRALARDAIAALFGDVSLYREAALQSAIRHEARARLAAKWLRDEHNPRKQKTLTLSERLALTATISNATDARDKCLKLAGLDSVISPASMWDAIDERRDFLPPDDSDDVSEAENNPEHHAASPSCELAPDSSRLASPSVSEDTNPPHHTTDTANAREGADLEARGGITEAGDTQAEYTREDRSH